MRFVLAVCVAFLLCSAANAGPIGYRQPYNRPYNPGWGYQQPGYGYYGGFGAGYSVNYGRTSFFYSQPPVIVPVFRTANGGYWIPPR